MASEALLLWGLVFSSIGLGFFVYGKKQQRLVPFVCGLALLICPYVSRVCSTVNCHRYCADGDTLLCQIVNVLKAFGGLVIPKSCG